jgi:hypothetical protein
MCAHFANAIPFNHFDYIHEKNMNGKGVEMAMSVFQQRGNITTWITDYLFFKFLEVSSIQSSIVLLTCLAESDVEESIN